MTSPARLRRVLLAGAALLPFGLYSIYLGQDANWDQRNYHVYNAYALLRGRLDYDVVPSGPQTFLPQLYNVPFFWLARAAPPRLTGFVLGLVHGANALVVFALARRVLAGTPHALTLAFLLTAVGVWSPATMSELGTTFGDNVTGWFLLVSVLVVARRLDDGDARRWAFASGVLAGVGTALKYTNAFYAVALVCAVGWLGLRRRTPRAAVAWLVAGLGVGFVVVAGPWAWLLWSRYGNPVLPYFNGAFRSPWWAPISAHDFRWVPTSLVDGLTYPFILLGIQTRTMEMAFRDPRWALLAVLGVAGCVMAVVARFREKPSGAPTSAVDGFVAIFAATSFVLWTYAFGYQRYLIPLEQMSGVLLLIAVRALVRDERLRRAAVVAACVVVVAGTTIPSWERRAWGPSWFGVHVDGHVPSDAIVLLSHRHPTAYVAPFFPRRVRFVKPELLVPNKYGPALDERIDTVIRAHRGPFRLLVKGGVADYERAMLARRGLEVTERCVRVQSHLDEPEVLQLCVVRRMEERPLEPARTAPDRTEGRS